MQVSGFSLVESVLVLAEKWHAWRASRTMLKWYRGVRSEGSRLIGRALYEQILVQRLGLNPIAAVAIIDHTEQSFCSWPSKREVRYRDVVSYMVVQDYLRSHHMLSGTVTDMRLVVARVIPPEL